MKLSDDELGKLGFASIGKRVAIDSSVAIFGSSHVHIGNDVRIDAFCVLSAGPGELRIGSNIHIAAGASIFAAAGVTMKNFSGLSGGVSVYSVSDDYVGGYLTNPTVPEKFKRVTRAPVCLEEHALVGAHSVVLPGVTLGRGCTAGALTLVNHDIAPFDVVAGNPMRVMAKRNQARLERLEAEYLASRAKE